MPDRSDDFAWENDLVAFRAYGPALRNGTENAGIDCWLKRVKYPIIDKWYDLHVNKNISYHNDHGEGLDPYHVGSSAGCGSTSLWLDGKRVPLETFVSYSNVSTDENRLSFTLTYENHYAGNTYKEEKKISLIPAVRLFKVETTFRKNGSLAQNLPISVGVTSHNGKAGLTFNTKQQWLSAWEQIEGSGLGTAVYVPLVYKVVAHEVKANGLTDHGHGLFLSHTDKNGKFVYYAGYGWEKAQEIVSERQWHDYLIHFIESHNYQAR